MPEYNHRLKILHVLDHSLPLHSGYTFRSQNIFRMQKNKGWDPVVLTSSKHEEGLKESGSLKSRPEMKENVDGIGYYRTGSSASSAVPFIPEVRIITSLARRLKEVALLEKPHVLHAHSPVLNAIASLLVGRRLGIPVVYEIRAFWEDAAVDHGTYRENSLKFRLVKSIETLVSKNVNEVAVICNGLRDDLGRRGVAFDKISVVPNGVNLEDFQHRGPDDRYSTEWDLRGKKVIGFIGSFYRYEGLDLLVDAFAKVSSTRPDVVLLLVGGGEVEGELREKIRAHDLGKKVIMPGRIPHERVPGVYQLIDVLVYPRYSMRLTELVTPLKPLEAMAMGKAVLASNIGGHRELIRNGSTGYLFPPGDVSALAAGMTKMLDDERFRKDLENLAMEWVRRERSWEKTTDAYVDIYSKVLKDDIRRSVHGVSSAEPPGIRAPLRAEYQEKRP